MKRRWRNLEIQIGAGLAGKILFLNIVPFRYAKPAIRKSDHPTIGGDKPRLQMWLGPLHYWSFLNDKPFEVSIEVNYNGGFHGTKPSGYNPLIRWFKSLVA